MLINDIKNINLPAKKEEEFLKIDFTKLFSYDFKTVQTSLIDLEGLKTVENKEIYESKLFSIAKGFDNNQKVLTISKDTNEPIILIHKLSSDETLFTNSLKIELEKNVKAQVIEVFVSKSQNSSFILNRDLVLGENSNLEYVKIQDIDSLNSMIFLNKSAQGDFSNLEITNFEFGEGFVVNSFENIIENHDINYELNGLHKLKNSANTSTLVKTTHNNKNSRSNINYKNTLLDSSRAVVKIKSIVNNNAPFSKAFQACNTILLSDDAVIFAQPFLEIFIDELEASHGTTTGTLNKEQLLYLQSRGISKKEAYEMLLEAFESSIAQNIKNEKMKKFVENYKRESYV